MLLCIFSIDAEYAFYGSASFALGIGIKVRINICRGAHIAVSEPHLNDFHIKRYVRKCRSIIGELRTGIGSLEADEKYQVQQDIEAIYEDAIHYVNAKLKNNYMLKYLLRDIDENFSQADTDDKKFWWVLFEILCLEEGRAFYKLLSESRDRDMYDLVPHRDGEIEIYGIRHTQKLVKSSRI